MLANLNFKFLTVLSFKRFTLGVLLILFTTTSTVYGQSTNLQGFNPSSINLNPFVQIHGLPGYKDLDFSADKNFLMLALNISNEYHLDNTANDSERIVLDFERTNFNLSLGHRINNDWMVLVNVPFVANNGGILDDSIEQWHDSFGLSEGGRDEAKDDQFLINYQHADTNLLINNKTQGIGDIQLFLARQLLKQNNFRANTVVELKLPTGKEQNLFGSGGYGLSFSVNATKKISNKFSAFSQAGVSFIENSKVLSEKQKNSVFTSVLGLAWHYNDKVNLSAALSYNSKVYQSELDAVEGEAGILEIAMRYQTQSKSQFELSFAEDLIIEQGGVDIGFSLSWRKPF